MRLFSHWFYLLRAALWLLPAFAKAARYVNRRALSALQLPEGLALSAPEKRRLKHYLYGTTYLSVLFCALRGRTRDTQEEDRFANLSALACFFDDLVDAFGKSDASGILWRDNPEEYGHVADKRGLALHLLYNVYAQLPLDKLTGFKAFMNRVFNVEASGRQMGSPVKTWQVGELEQMIAEKGGCSVLMFRQLLNHPLGELEEVALYRFGALIQLCDDIFDVWFDKQDETNTLATQWLEQGQVSVLKDFFETQVTATRRAFRDLYRTGPNISYPRQNVETALAVLHYLVAITRVCLDHYQWLSEQGPFPWAQRRLMVVDMERWGNRVRTVRYIAQGE